MHWSPLDLSPVLYFTGVIWVLMTSPPALLQASSPPRRHATLVKPFASNVSTAPALVCSAGQVQ